MEEQYPYDRSLEQVMVEHRKANRNPSIRYVSDTVLREGPLNSKVATIFQIVNQHTGELHHYSLRLETAMKRRATGWQFSEEKSITLGEPEEGSTEIGKLVAFIVSVTKGLLPDEDGSYIVIDSRNQTASELLKLLQNVDASQRLELVFNVLSELSKDSHGHYELEKILDSKDGSLLRGIAVASKLVEYRRAYDYLERLVEFSDPKEQLFQAHLKDNPWMFGSEYSELLDRRAWTRDDKQDFMLRRTVDGYLEIIEIKTPAPNLFNQDASHDGFYPSRLLSQAIGQVMKYIEEIDLQCDHIRAHDSQDPLKIRARIIIGRDGDKPQQEALRNLNSHLNRIEVLTYDQLLRIAERVLRVFESQQSAMSDDIDDDDLPF